MNSLVLTDQNRVKRGVELVVLCAILVVGILSRTIYLSADPPLGLSTSADVYTDPSQYTLYAKNYVQTGEIEPIEAPDYPFFKNSSVTALAVIVFSLFGVGIWQSNLVGLIFSFGSILLFYLFMRRAAGTTTALLFLLFASFNYNLIFYGRLPFLEHAMTFFAFASLVLITYSRRLMNSVLAGSLLAVAILFSKMTGIILLFPIGIYLLFDFSTRKLLSLKSVVRNFGLFGSGFLIVSFIWLLFVYLPSSNVAGGYLVEKSVGLYGLPEAFHSVDDFIFKMVSFGRKEMLFSRMPLLSVLAGLFVGWTVQKLGRSKFVTDVGERVKPEHLFLLAMIVSFYGALMIWNYRPLRYSLVLVYPLLGAASIMISYIWKCKRALNWGRLNVGTYLAMLVISLIVVYQLGKGLSLLNSFGFYWSDDRGMIYAIALGLSVASLLLIIIYRRGSIYLPTTPVRLFVVALLLLTTLIHSRKYIEWLVRPAFTMQEASRDLGFVLSETAVLSGPFAPLLTLENRLQTVIHMFGVTDPDPVIFAKYGFTHLLLDSGNEKKANEYYPEIIDSAPLLVSYNLGKRTARLFQVAGLTQNARADSYEKSLYEQAHACFAADSFVLGHHYIDSMNRQNESNISGHFLLARQAEYIRKFDLAEIEYKKAVENSATNYVLIRRVAEFLEKRYKATENEQYRIEKDKLFDRANHFVPGDRLPLATIKEFEGFENWLKSADTISGSRQ